MEISEILEWMYQTPTLGWILGYFEMVEDLKRLYFRKLYNFLLFIVKVNIVTGKTVTT